jgi:hypothetical protein
MPIPTVNWVSPNTTLESPVEAWQLWVNAFGKNRSVGVSSEARSDFIAGQRLLIDTNRGVLGSKSGVTISNKFPCVISMTLNDDRAVVALDPDAILGQTPARVMQIFVEHQRIIVANALNTRVAI